MAQEVRSTSPTRQAREANICRVCGISILKSTKYFNAFRDEEFLMCLKSALPGEDIHAADGLPTSVCVVCHRKVKNLTAHKERIMAVDRMLKDTTKEDDSHSRSCWLCICHLKSWDGSVLSRNEQLSKVLKEVFKVTPVAKPVCRSCKSLLEKVSLGHSNKLEIASSYSSSKRKMQKKRPATTPAETRAVRSNAAEKRLKVDGFGGIKQVLFSDSHADDQPPLPRQRQRRLLPAVPQVPREKGVH